jgi:excisionase family DNA binding protein
MSIAKALRKRAGALNVAEVAKLFFVTESTVQRWVRKRQIPAIRIGDVIRFDGGMLADWIELEGACACPPNAPSDPEDYLHWQDLGELVPEEVVRTPGITQQREATKTEPQ